MTIPREEIEKILDKYQSKLNKRLSNSGQYNPDPNFSREYSQFKKEATSRKRGVYENLCNFSETILKTSPAEKDFDSIKESIEMTHLKITPGGASSFVYLWELFLMFLVVMKVLDYLLLHCLLH